MGILKVKGPAFSLEVIYGGPLQIASGTGDNYRESARRDVVSPLHLPA